MPRRLRDSFHFGDGASTPRCRRARKHSRKSLHYGAANLWSMPVVILLDLEQYLYLPELSALSTTCKHFYNVFAESLVEEQAFARKDMRDIKLTSNNFGYHDLLLGFLKREVNPNYIRRFDCRTACLSAESSIYPGEGDKIDVAHYIGWTAEDISLIRATILRLPWLEDFVTPDELIHRMLQRDEDALLALLVALMKNLCFFLPPRVAPLLPQVFVKIARAQIVAERTNPDAWQRLPLRRIHTIYAMGSDWDNMGMPLLDTIHYISLPSVRRVFLAGVDHYSPRPRNAECAGIRFLKGVPRSRASAVYIRAGALWRDVAEAFTDHLAGPCILRHYLDEGIPDEIEAAQAGWVAQRLRDNGVSPQDPLSYYWDHCIISPGPAEDFAPSSTSKNRGSHSSQNTGGRTVKFTIKYRSIWQGSATTL